ncbi:MAG: nitrous oxide reductase family maturation protein NosD [Acidobacteriota bacterium]|jgi:nitrous oxidase accessory protein
MDRLKAAVVAALAAALTLTGAPAGAAEVRRVAPGELPAALATAQPGETLLLQAGVHRGALTIATPLRLIGEPGAVVEGDGSGTVLTLSGPGIEVADLVVRGSGPDLAADDAVVLVLETEGVVVRDCRIEARAFGIYLRGGGHHRVVGNVIVGDASLAEGRRGNGIHLWQTVANEVRDNEVVAARDGVYLSFAHDNVIEGNVGRGLRYGIHYMYSERNTLAGNEFSDCRGGIALMYSRGNRIIANALAGNSDFGILLLQLEDSVLEDNAASENGRGVYLENSAANRLHRNRLRGNGVGAYLTAGSERNLFTANRFDANVVQVYDDHAGDNRWFDERRGNYWSDYGGFDWDGDGVGDTPYRIQTAASALLARRPAARWLWRSPILGLLDWWEGQVMAGGGAPAGGSGAFDRFPLVTPSAGPPPAGNGPQPAGPIGGERP